jgi:hypothetical protein
MATERPWTGGEWSYSSAEAWDFGLIHATDTDGVVVVGDCDQTDVDERSRNANGRLMASAPAMYEALSSLLDLLDAGFDPRDIATIRVRYEARAALAKANGGDA